LAAVMPVGVVQLACGTGLVQYITKIEPMVGVVVAILNVMVCLAF
jgi:hypothetical protein